MPVTAGQAKIVIDGEAHRRFLKSVGRVAHRLEPLSEEEFVQRVLDFANWSGEDMWRAYDLEAMLTMGAKNAQRDRSTPGPEPDAMLQGLAFTERQRMVGFRDALREQLEPIADNIQQHRSEHSQEYFMLFEELASIPRPVLIGGRLELQSLYMPADLLAAFDYAKLLLMAENKPFGERLIRCHLPAPACGNFFLQPKPTGRKRSKYCCTEHMEKAHGARAAERMRRMRERRANRGRSARKPK